LKTPLAFAETYCGAGILFSAGKGWHEKKPNDAE
jgi:hypothetical protein